MQKSLKFYNTDKWCIRETRIYSKNEKHKIFWDFEIQINHQISARIHN